MDIHKISDSIDAVSIPKDATITQLTHEEDSEPYQVWRIDTHTASYILKEAKGKETTLYTTVLSTLKASVPTLYQAIPFEDKTYLLMQYIAGENLCRCDRRKLTYALDALISLQKQTWEAETLVPDSFETSLWQRQDRGKYLNDPLLETVYEKFLAVYRAVPKALCHDDLLPFNILASEQKAYLIDWECGGILPYPASFARLIAHTQEDADALFYMTEADKCFAIDYYYDNLLKEKGISYESWRHTLEFFLFYEYCEWVFVGNKYDATDGQYYQKYLPLAKQQAAKLFNMANL